MAIHAAPAAVALPTRNSLRLMRPPCCRCLRSLGRFRWTLRRTLRLSRPARIQIETVYSHCADSHRLSHGEMVAKANFDVFSKQRKSDSIEKRVPVHPAPVYIKMPAPGPSETRQQQT